MAKFVVKEHRIAKKHLNQEIGIAGEVRMYWQISDLRNASSVVAL